MTLDEIRILRLNNQQILHTNCKTPADVVAYFGAMQAQEYAMAKWAVGLRLIGIVEADVEAAFQSGQILRTHLLRPTWHFVVPEDIRWLLKLTAPHVQRRNAGMYRNTGLTPGLLLDTCRIIEKALSSGAPMTREQLAAKLSEAGVTASGHRLSYIMMNAELEGVICSGARNEKQFTYTLLDDVAPQAASLCREEAIARLARRYFTSRGPATAQDFSYWSGLTVKDARIGISSLGDGFAKVAVGKNEYYFAEPPVTADLNERATFLLPDYDEYGMGYKDRKALAPSREPRETPYEYSHWLIVGGRVEGTWQFHPSKRADVTATPYYEPDSERQHELDAAVARYQAFWIKDE